MALAQKSFASLRILGVKPRMLLSNFVVSKTSVATIVSRSSRLEPVDKPAPWPYREKGFRNWHAYIDKTKKRIDENSKLIVVEGLPAIGKTKLAKSLAEELEMHYLPMITADNYYISAYGYDYRQMNKDLPRHLHSFDEYDFLESPKDPKVIHLEFVLWVQKFRQYMDALSHILNTGQGVILDRCVYSAPVFQEALYEKGHISKQERECLNVLVKRHMGDLMKPHLVVYLDASPEVSAANLKNRGLGEERVWNKEILERVAHHYKYDYLKKISEHAELVAYDWNTPGDGEVMVEDIERIDFDRFSIHDPKMEDWRLKDEWDWAEKRWEFTNMIRQSDALDRILCTEHLMYIPALALFGEDAELMEEVRQKVPGHKYPFGFNAEQGDKFMFRTRHPQTIWVDHHAERQEKEKAKRRQASTKT